MNEVPEEKRLNEQGLRPVASVYFRDVPNACKGDYAMNPLPKYPVIYEINTWTWLHELSVKYRSLITLATVPEDEWDVIGRLAVDAIWFMGVWERSPTGIDIANRNEDLLADFRRALPDYRTEDNVGSPYCVRQYEIDGRLGSREGLAEANKNLLGVVCGLS